MNNTLSTGAHSTSTEMTTEASTTTTIASSAINFDSYTPDTLELDDDKKASKIKVHMVICCAIIFMLLGKIIIPIIVCLTFTFEFEIVDQWNADIHAIEVAICRNPQEIGTKTQCYCDGGNSDNDLCEIDIEGSYVEVSIALNTMVLIVESLWFIRMIFGLKRHSLCTKLGIFEAIGQLTRDSKCCLFVWRIFEFAWYLYIIFQFDALECHCVVNENEFEWTQKGIFYKISYYLDITALGVIGLYLLSKTTFFGLMSQMTQTHGAYYDMGAFFAVLKVYYMNAKSFGDDKESVSVWSPLKQEQKRKEDIKYEAQNLKLHYKGWK